MQPQSHESLCDTLHIIRILMTHVPASGASKMIEIIYMYGYTI